MKGSSNTKKFKKFQIRWAEKLGFENNPYLIRWTFIFFGYSMRIHHWIKSDDNRFFHDHSADLLSIVLKGRYWNVKPFDINLPPIYNGNNNSKWFYVEGIFNSWYNFFHMKNSIWFSKAEDRTNHFNECQGEFKYGKLDISSLQKRILNDVKNINFEVELTHCDEMDRVKEFENIFNIVNTYDTPVV